MIITRVLALFITLTSMAMAGVASWDRGGSLPDRVLLVSLSLAIIAAVHFLPAVSKRPVSWFLWVGCVLCAIYGHMVFFANASLRAGDVRVAHSRDMAGVERQITETKAALAAINARPISVVASDLATETKWRERQALRMELAEAKRAQQLRDTLLQLENNAVTTEKSAAIDPVTAQLSSVLGESAASIMLIIGLCFSFLLEMVGALIWYEVLHAETRKVTRVTTVTRGVTAGVTGVTDDVTGGVTAVTGVTEVTERVTSEVVEETDALIHAEPAHLDCAQTACSKGGLQTHLDFDVADEASVEKTPAVVLPVAPIALPALAGAVLVEDEDLQLEYIKAAIADKKCTVTVRGIREFLNSLEVPCSSKRAMKLRNILLGNDGSSPEFAAA